MSQLEALIVRGHRKIIEYYRQLDSAKSDQERLRFQRCTDEEEALLRRMTENFPAQRAV